MKAIKGPRPPTRYKNRVISKFTPSPTKEVAVKQEDGTVTVMQLNRRDRRRMLRRAT